ncbi:50S ribosomal protein L7/L12 [Hibiscus syriacus]|uniref:50S ribosomal protein L7/L12 n=1 Tax=Hibiscus syriacus TaxID=106335 RepID=A0A6A3A805_HIBSY|nr:50S ribosomal protein L7/L12-like [Hibiscus syriacus]KAE8700076.1 50S ribosomal protein L7/L12 [Hibiscus syriacus]
MSPTMASIVQKILTIYLFKNLISSSPKPPVFRFFSTATCENRTQKLERIADELLDLTKLERYDYSILFRLKLGLNRYGPAVSGVTSPAASAGSGAAETKAAEKTAFDIKLEKFDAAAKIKIIKEVRTFTDLGLKEAKDLVEKVPVVVKKGVTKEDAEAIIKKLQELGATAVLE